jgi:hypothetical protein
MATDASLILSGVCAEPADLFGLAVYTSKAPAADGKPLFGGLSEVIDVQTVNRPPIQLAGLDLLVAAARHSTS